MGDDWPRAGAKRNVYRDLYLPRAGSQTDVVLEPAPARMTPRPAQFTSRRQLVAAVFLAVPVRMPEMTALFLVEIPAVVAVGFVTAAIAFEQLGIAVVGWSAGFRVHARRLRFAGFAQPACASRSAQA